MLFIDFTILKAVIYEHIRILNINHNTQYRFSGDSLFINLYWLSIFLESFYLMGINLCMNFSAEVEEPPPPPPPTKGKRGRKPKKATVEHWWVETGLFSPAHKLIHMYILIFPWSVPFLSDVHGQRRHACNTTDCSPLVFACCIRQAVTC